MRSHIRRLLESAGFSPRQLFAALQGAWLEPRSGSIWQENTGVTPTTTGGQTIGKIADLSGYGNVATQATAANRPTLQFNGALPLARFDTNDFLSLSLPDLGGGVFSNAGSVYFSTPVGMSQLNNQSMGTTYTLPALSSDIYSWMVFPQRLSAVQESRLARYMQQKAGIAGDDYLWESFRRNLVSYSEALDNADWATKVRLAGFGSGSIANTTETLDPTGLNTAEYVRQATGQTTGGGIIANFALSVNTYTLSGYFKAKEKTWVNLAGLQGGSSLTRAYFNLTSGVPGYYGCTSSSIVSVGNGWYRCVAVYTITNAAIAALGASFGFYLADTNNSTTVTDSGGVYVWGMQLDLGSVATPYQRIDAGPDPYTVVQDTLLMDDGTEILLAQ